MIPALYNPLFTGLPYQPAGETRHLQ